MRPKAIFLLLAVLVASPATAGMITYDFADGTMQGWSVVSADPGLTFLAGTVGEYGNTEQWGGADDYYMSQVDFGNRDNAHQTLLVRSPEFVLGDDGALSVRTYGGTVGATMPGSVIALASSTSASDGVHAMGVALRDAATDTYLLTTATGGGNSPLMVGFTRAELAPYVGTQVTVDVFDSYAGGWGWVVFDDVTVPTAVHLPEPVTLTILAVGGLALLRERRRRGRAAACPEIVSDLEGLITQTRQADNTSARDEVDSPMVR